MIIKIPQIYEEDIIAFVEHKGNVIFKYFNEGKLVELIFKCVYFYDFVEFEYIKKFDWRFGLQVRKNSKYINNLVADMAEEKLQNAFGGEVNELKHYKLAIDDVGVYNIVCKDFEILKDSELEIESVENANNRLRFHGDFYAKNSFLYQIKEEGVVDEDAFSEIMTCLRVLSEKMLDLDQIKSVYSIIFWCRSWLGTECIEKYFKLFPKEKLQVYVQLIENALFYLMEGNVEEAFWVYNEFLDGRYQG